MSTTLKMFFIPIFAFFMFVAFKPLPETSVMLITITEDQKLSAEIVMPIALINEIVKINEDETIINISDTKISAEILKDAIETMEENQIELLTVTDHKAKSEVQLSVKKDFKSPPKSVTKSRSFVVEVYEGGNLSTTIRIPGIVMQGLALIGKAKTVIDGKDMGMDFFSVLRKTGGFVYIKDYQDRSEVYIYYR